MIQNYFEWSEELLKGRRIYLLQIVNLQHKKIHMRIVLIIL